MIKELTKKQKAVLEFIGEFITLYGFAPTAEEIGSNFHINPSAAQKHVDRLYVKGYLLKISNTPRGLVVLGDV